jgi:MFS family permease
MLSIWRVLTGLGIGGMLAATNAAVAESSNTVGRNFCFVIMAAGYPVGGFIGGSISAAMLRQFDWPIIFQFGAIMTLCFIPLVLWRAPESIAYQTQHPGPDTLSAINRTLSRMGHPTIEALALEVHKAPRAPLAALFSPALARTTIVLTVAYLAHIMTFYFVLKWIPKIVVDMGFAPSSAAGVLVSANVGGVTGSVLLGLFTAKVRVRTLTMAAMLFSAILIVIFGHGQTNLSELEIIAAVAGFFTNAGVVGLYALLAQSFPAEVRATATGFAIGVGRGGSALAPALTGFLFAAGYGLQAVAILMALGSVIGFFALLGLGGRTAVR